MVIPVSSYFSGYGFGYGSVTVLVTVTNIPPSPLIAMLNGLTTLFIRVLSQSVTPAHSQSQEYWVGLRIWGLGVQVPPGAPHNQYVMSFLGLAVIEK